jgi:hypothetical protein
MDGPDAKAYANRMLTHHGTSACDGVAVRMSRMFRRKTQASRPTKRTAVGGPGYSSNGGRSPEGDSG